MHEWVQGLVGSFQHAQEEERQGRGGHTFQAGGDSQQTLMGTHVTKALQVNPSYPKLCMMPPGCARLSRDGVASQFDTSIAVELLCV